MWKRENFPSLCCLCKYFSEFVHVYHLIILSPLSSKAKQSLRFNCQRGGTDLAPARDVQILKLKDGVLNTKHRRNKYSGSGKVMISLFCYVYISQVCISEQITPQN